MTEKLVVYIDGITTGLQKALADASKNLKNFGENLEQSGTRLSVGLSLPLALFAKKAIDAYGDVDALSRGLATLEKNATTLTARLQKLDAIPNLGFKDAVKADLQLRTVLEQMYGIEGASKLSTKAIDNFNNALKLTGKGADEFNRVAYGLQQLANTEFPLGEDINIIKDALPQATTLLNEAFGTARSEDLQKLSITSKQVIDTLISGLEKLPRATVGVKQAFADFAEGIEKRFGRVGEMLSKNIDFESIFNKITGTIDGLLDAFDRLSPSLQKAIIGFGGLAIVLPPIMAGLGVFITTILPAITAGFLALTSPIGLVVVAITAAASAIISNWGKVKEMLVDTGVWDKLVKTAETGLGYIIEGFQVFKSLLTGDFKGMFEGLLNIAKRGWNLIVSTALSFTETAIKINQKLFGAIGLDSMVKGGDVAIKSLQDFSKNLQFEVPPVTNAMKSLKDAFSGFTFGGDRIVNPKKLLGVSAGEIEKELKDFRASFLKGLEKIKETPIGDNFIGEIYSKLFERNKSDRMNAIVDAFKDTPQELSEAIDKSLKGYDFGAKFRDKLANIKITSPNISFLSNDQMISNDIEEYLKKFKDKLGMLSIPPEVFEKWKQSIKDGMNVSDAVDATVQQMVDRLALATEAVKTVFNGMGDVVALGFAKMLNPKGVDFKKGFDQILGRMLSSLGSMLMEYGTKIVVASKLVQGAIAAMATGNPVPALGLIALGAALKGAGMALTANENNSTNRIDSNNNIAPNYNTFGLTPQKVEVNGRLFGSGTDLVAVIGNTNQSWNGGN
jgi:tape measure domain-containing protein